MFRTPISLIFSVRNLFPCIQQSVVGTWQHKAVPNLSKLHRHSARSCSCNCGFGLGSKPMSRMGQVFSVIGAGRLSCQQYANCQNSRGAPSWMVPRTDWRCRILNQRRRVSVIITGHFCSIEAPQSRPLML